MSSPNLKKSKSRTRSASLSKINPSATFDNKLSHASLMLTYLFEHKVDFKRRIINLTGEVNDEMYDRLSVALTEMEAEGKSTVIIKINSQGGDTYAAMAIVGRIRESTCHIITKGYGAIMSAATLILAAGRRRMMSEYGQFMWHEASYELGHDKHSVHKNTVEQAEAEEHFWAISMSKFTDKTKDFWLKKGVGRDAYFDAKTLLDLGVVDELF